MGTTPCALRRCIASCRCELAPPASFSMKERRVCAVGCIGWGVVETRGWRERWQREWWW